MISFSKFILKYCDDWNVGRSFLADDLDVSLETLRRWMYEGIIPDDKYDDVLETYFGDDLKNVKFDGKKFRRKIKVTRPDGSYQIYNNNTDISKVEGITKDAITRHLRIGELSKRGKFKGYKFEKIYVEVD